MEDDEKKNDGKKNDGIARGYAVGMSVLAISAQIVVFPLIGFYIDGKLHTGALFGGIGFAVGLYTAITQLIRLPR